MVATHPDLAINPSHGWSVWGHDATVNQLQRSVATAPAHAYLFTGPPSTGKRLAALNYATSLCCQAPPNPGQFCGACSVCRRIRRGVFPDVTIFDLKGQAEREREKSRNLTLNIGTVREISSAVSYRPTESQWRIAIVDDAETMQETAQEALLKTLEEPPPYAMLILLATDAERLLDTIRSRCATIRFGSASRAQIIAALVAHGVGSGEADAIASLANGLTGWAMDAARESNLLDQRRETMDEAIRLVAADRYGRMIGAVRLADSFASDRTGTIARIQALQEVWRAALLDAIGVNNNGVRSELAPVIARAGIDDLVRAAQSIDICIEHLEANVRPRLALESMVLAWPDEISQ